MARTAKTLRIEFGPSPALTALLALHGAGAHGPWPLSPRVHQAVDAEVARLAGSLDTLASCIDWLEDRDLVAVRRPRGEKTVRRARAAHPAYRVAASIDLDVPSLVEGVSSGDDTEGAEVSVAAVFTVFSYLQSGALSTPGEVRVDGRLTDVQGASATLQAALARAGYVIVSDTPTRSARAARAPHAPRRAVKKKTRQAARAALAGKKRPVPPPARTPSAPTDRKSKARVETKATGRPAAARSRPKSASFGGLPEDAQPEDRSAATKVEMGPRGVTLDAEFFLEYAGIAAWPCAPADLERGRRRALARLHPDRPGEGSAALFQRATRGHAELARRLVESPRPEVPAEPARAEAPGVANSVPRAPGAPRSLVGEWPPRCPAPVPSARESRNARATG